ncbi:hypothetical protein IWX47DRAFT_535422 [Phyllosticta citricarpa]
MMYPPPPLGMAQASAIRRCQFLASLPPVLLCLSQIHPYKSKLPLHPPTAPAQELTMAPPPPPPFRSSSSTRDPHSASAPRPRGDLDQASIDPLNHIIYPPPPLPPPPPPAAAAPHPCPDAQDMSSLGYMMPTQYGSFTPSGTSFDPYGYPQDQSQHSTSQQPTYPQSSAAPAPTLVSRDIARSRLQHPQDTCPERTTPLLSQGQQGKRRSTRPSTLTSLHPALCPTEPTTRRETFARANF